MDSEEKHTSVCLKPQVIIGQVVANSEESSELKPNSTILGIILPSSQMTISVKEDEGRKYKVDVVG